MEKSVEFQKKDEMKVITQDELEEAAVCLVKALLREEVPLEDIQYLSGKSVLEIDRISKDGEER